MVEKQWLLLWLKTVDFYLCYLGILYLPLYWENVVCQPKITVLMILNPLEKIERSTLKLELAKLSEDLHCLWPKDVHLALMSIWFSPLANLDFHLVNLLQPGQ